MKSWFAVLLLGLVSSTAFAEVGKLPMPGASVGAVPSRVKLGGFCRIYGPESEAWSCDHLGNVTIRQVYERGWRVVSLVESSRGLQSKMVIEEQ